MQNMQEDNEGELEVEDDNEDDNKSNISISSQQSKTIERTLDGTAFKRMY